MISRYRIFCQVAELGSFTRAAEQLGYSQSAVSQTVRSVEQELGVTLLERRKDGVRLTADAEQYYPYLRAIAAAENALHHKQQEMEGLENSVIRIGTFTSVSRTLLPPLMKRFKEQYPSVRFVLRQGEYTGIARWLREGSIDFGFVCAAAVTGMETCVLYEDEMMAVLPEAHPLAKKSVLTLQDLLGDPLIVLDEGEYSLALTAFEREGLSPDAAYTVYDDYTILAMVRQGLGVSLLYEKVLSGFEAGLAIRPFVTAPRRVVALAYPNRSTLSYASRRFCEAILRQCRAENSEI